MRRAPFVLVLAVIASSCGTETSPPGDGDDDPACTDGSFRSTTGLCQVWTECAAGSRIVSNPSATADRTCTGCVTGTFSTAANSVECSLWTECAAGSYVSNVPSATVDRACLPCAEGTNTTSANLSTCVTEPCAPGSELSGDVCVACTTGSYCAGGAAAAVACAAGTWDHDANPATLCAAHTTCVAGEVVTAAGTATTDRACEPCPADAYSAAPNSASCTPRLVCGEGMTPENTPTSSACVCDGGTWDDDGDPETPCVAQDVCEPGEYVAVEGTPVVAQVCEACAAETFSDASNASACAAWTTCAAPGSYMTSSPSASQDRSCDTCPDVMINATTLSTYTSEDNALACCTYPDPSSSSVVVNVAAQDIEETVEFGPACASSSDGCVLTNDLLGFDPNTFNAYTNVTGDNCASTYSYGWQIRYPTTINGGSAYVARGITGTTTAALDILPNTLPNIGTALWRMRVTITNTTTGVTLERRFRFRYIDSSTSLAQVAECQSATPPQTCRDNILLP